MRQNIKYIPMINEPLQKQLDSWLQQFMGKPKTQKTKIKMAKGIRRIILRYNIKKRKLNEEGSKKHQET